MDFSEGTIWNINSPTGKQTVRSLYKVCLAVTNVLSCQHYCIGWKKLGSLLLHCNLCVCWCFFSNVFRYKITGCWVAGPERGHKYNKIKSCGYDAHWVLTWFPARGRTCKGHQFQVEPLVTMFKHIVKPCWTPNTTDPNRSGGVARNIVPSQFRYGSNLAAEFLPVSGVFLPFSELSHTWGYLKYV